MILTYPLSSPEIIEFENSLLPNFTVYVGELKKSHQVTLRLLIISSFNFSSSLFIQTYNLLISLQRKESLILIMFVGDIKLSNMVESKNT